VSDESPFAPPDPATGLLPPGAEPIGPRRAVLGLLICLYSIAILGWALWLAVVETERDPSAAFGVAILLAVAVPSLIGGWRWTERKRAWPWLVVPGILHAVLAAAIALSSIYE
jgi:hypothetical protein